MTKSAKEVFHNRLRIMKSIDMHELVDVGVIPIGHVEAYRSFSNNPYDWFIRASREHTDAVWEIILRREKGMHRDE